MTTDPLADRPRLADIEDIPLAIPEHIDARLVRQGAPLLGDATALGRLEVRADLDLRHPVFKVRPRLSVAAVPGIAYRFWALSGAGTTGRRLLGCLLALVAALIVASPAAGAELRAPDPGGRENAIVQVPPPGKRFLAIHEPTIIGGSEHGWDADDIARMAKGAGANMVRFTIDWSQVERIQDVWNEPAWGIYRNAYRALIERGIKPLIGLSIAPPWARASGYPMLCGGTRGCEYPPRPEMLYEWAEFAAEVARRFPQTGAIEIWNEPNLSNFYKPEPHPEYYALLVTRAYDAIKAVSPNIQVLAGALAGADRSERTVVPELKVILSMREFLSRAYQATPSLAGHMDGLSFHQASQSIRFGKDSQMAMAFRQARQARKRYDIRRTPLWVSEFGLSTTDGDRVTPAVQADALLRAYRKVITMRDVRGFVLHTLGDQLNLPYDHGEHGVGLVAGFEPFTPKPAYCAFAGRFRGETPRRPCVRIKESRVSRCTRKLVSLRGRIADASGAERAALKRRHARKTLRCVPRIRKVERLKRSLAGASGSRRAEIRAKISKLEQLHPDCDRKLRKLQKRHGRAIVTLRLDLLNRHERVRRRCR